MHGIRAEQSLGRASNLPLSPVKYVLQITPPPLSVKRPWDGGERGGTGPGGHLELRGQGLHFQEAVA